MKSLEKFNDFIQQLHDQASFHDNSIIVPIIINDEVIGLFLLNTTQIYSSEQLSFLGTLIGQGGLAIENALLYKKLTIKMSKKNKQKLIDKKKRLNEYLKTLPQSTFQQNYITEDIFDHDSD